MMRNLIESAAKRVTQTAILLVLTIALVVVVRAEQLTPEALVGVWDCKTVAMNDHGKPGSGLEFKPQSMVYTFRNDGRWTMEATDPTHTKKTGTYQLQSTKLILKNEDGSTYQDWQIDLMTDGTRLLVKDKKLFLTFGRVTSTP